MYQRRSHSLEFFPLLRLLLCRILLYLLIPVCLLNGFLFRELGRETRLEFFLYDLAGAQTEVVVVEDLEKVFESQHLDVGRV